jgi:hypothetical protein
VPNISQEWIDELKKEI